MSETFQKIKMLVGNEDVRISDHGYRQIQDRAFVFEHLLASVAKAELVEDYPDFHKGPSVLMLTIIDGEEVHMVWGIPKGQDRPTWLVTAYRPDPAEWMPDNKTRRPKL